jgi:hypothetical protein
MPAPDRPIPLLYKDFNKDSCARLAGSMMHAMCSSFAMKSSSQDIQSVAPSLLYVLPEHTWQVAIDVAPISAENVPGGQGREMAIPF